MSGRKLISSLMLLFTIGAEAQSDYSLSNSAVNELTERSSHFAKNEAYAKTPDVNMLFSERKKGRVILGYTENSLPVEAYFFPGTSDKKAMIIAGVHGSELASIDVAKMIIAQLETSDRPYYNVVVVPSLFPANAERARLKDSNGSFGRYTSEHHTDPNRQMPRLGQAFDAEVPVDAHGRLIENENRYLLKLIQQFQPSRIANLHAIKDTTKAGIYADPRTDCEGIALGFETDSILAITMADFIWEKGGCVPGNRSSKEPTALYYKDPSVVPAGSIQKRNLLGATQMQHGSWSIKKN